MSARLWRMLPAMRQRYDTLDEDDRVTVRMLLRTLAWTSLGVIVAFGLVAWTA